MFKGFPDPHFLTTHWYPDPKKATENIYSEEWLLHNITVALRMLYPKHKVRAHFGEWGDIPDIVIELLHGKLERPTVFIWDELPPTLDRANFD